jgi:hypothetical protein
MKGNLSSVEVLSALTATVKQLSTGIQRHTPVIVLIEETGEHVVRWVWSDDEQQQTVSCFSDPNGDAEYSYIETYSNVWNLAGHVIYPTPA